MYVSPSVYKVSSDPLVIRYTGIIHHNCLKLLKCEYREHNHN